jgi:excisionase family DNA binding protein
MPTPNNEVMTLDELSVYLKIPKSTLYKLVQEGCLPGQKIGKQWRFGKQGIDQWLAEGGPPGSRGSEAQDV